MLAARRLDGTYLYNPSGGFVIEPQTHLIVIARSEDVQRLREGLDRNTIGAQTGRTEPPPPAKG